MRQPEVYTADQIKEWSVTKNGGADYWYLARPLGHTAFSWWWRFALAYDVLLGRRDVLFWRA